MAALPDHYRRDAEHAARTEISVVLGKFQRRMNEASKAIIANTAADDGTVIDFDSGTEAGRKAAAKAIAEYLFDNPGQVADRPTITAG
jgi:hypothetical protein